ncbi:MAG: hypothetical protein ACREJB_16305 [Planctomycetaceae bacterium]
MAMVELTYEQIINAARQLPEDQRRQLAGELQRLPTREEALEASDRLGGQFRLPAAKQKRMSTLLAKGNEGTLNPEESRELDRLIEEYETRRLEFVRAIAGSASPPDHTASAAGRTNDR